MNEPKSETMIGSPEHQPRATQEKTKGYARIPSLKTVMIGTGLAVGLGVVAKDAQAAKAIEYQPPAPDNRIAWESGNIVENETKQFEAAGLTNPNLSGSAGTTIESVLTPVNQEVAETQTREALSLGKFTLDAQAAQLLQQSIGTTIDRTTPINIMSLIENNALGTYIPNTEIHARINELNATLEAIRSIGGQAEFQIAAAPAADGQIVISEPYLYISQDFSSGGVTLPEGSIFFNSSTYMQTVDRPHTNIDAHPSVQFTTPGLTQVLQSADITVAPESFVLTEVETNGNPVSIAGENIKYSLLRYETIHLGQNFNLRPTPSANNEPLMTITQAEPVTFATVNQERIAGLPSFDQATNTGLRQEGEIFFYYDQNGDEYVLVADPNTETQGWINFTATNHEEIQATATPAPQGEAPVTVVATATPFPDTTVPGGNLESTPMSTPGPGEPGAPTATPQEVVDLSGVLNNALSRELPEGVTRERVVIAENAIRAQYQNDPAGVYRYEWNNAESRWIDHNPGRSGRNSAEALLAEVGFFEDFNPAEWRWDQDLMMYRDLNGNIFMRGMGTELINGSYNQADRRDGLSTITLETQTPDFELGRSGVDMIWAVTNTSQAMEGFDINSRAQNPEAVRQLLAQNFLNLFPELEGKRVVLDFSTNWVGNNIERSNSGGVDPYVADWLSNGADDGTHLGNPNVLHVKVLLNPGLPGSENIFAGDWYADQYIIEATALAIREALTGREGGNLYDGPEGGLIRDYNRGIYTEELFNLLGARSQDEYNALLTRLSGFRDFPYYTQRMAHNPLFTFRVNQSQ